MQQFFFPHNRKRHHRHVAIVFRGGAVIAVAKNGTRHAEVAALSKLWPSKRRGTSVLSLRIRSDGSLALAAPCPACRAYMREFGVKKVRYSTAAGGIASVRIKVAA